MPPASVTSLAQRRRLLGGKIIFNGKMSIFDCVVRRMTPEGAVITLNSTLGIPNFFELKIAALDASARCEIEERSEKELKVRFHRMGV